MQILTLQVAYRRGGYLLHQRALFYTHMNSGSLPRAPHCGDSLYHMVESPMFPRTVLSTL